MRQRPAFQTAMALLALALAGTASAQTPPAAPQPPASPPAAPAAPTAPAPGPGAAPATPPAAQPPADPNRPQCVPDWFYEMDVNHDKYVSREEFVAARLKVFGELDANKDDFLSLEEFLKLAEPPHSVDGPGVPPLADRRKYFELQFQQMDVDRDSKLTRDEVEAFVIVNFNDFDLNRDGRISIPEVCQVTIKTRPQPQRGPEALNLQEFIESELRNIMQLDTNSDGKISLEEFLVTAGPPDNDPSLPKGTMPLAQRRAIVTQRFNEIDTNRDKFIDKNEWVALLTKRFKEIDTNNDGKITPEEFKVHLERTQRAAQQPAPAPRPAPAPAPAPRPAPPPAGQGGMPPGAPLPQR